MVLTPTPVDRLAAANIAISALTVANATALGLSALVFLLAYRQHRGQPCFAYWSAGNSLAAAGTLLLAQADTPPMVFLVTAVGRCIYWAGLRRFFAVRLPWRATAAVLVLTAIALVVARRWAEASPTVISAVMQISLAAIFAAMASDVFRHMRANAIGQLLTLCLALEVLVLVLCAAGDILILNAPDSSAVFLTQQLALIDSFGLLLLTFAASWCNTMLVSEQIRTHLSHMASTDTLTGLLNRRAFLDLAPDRLEPATNCSGTGAAVLVMDLDHFKSVNDIYGHQAGDEVLRQFGILLRRSVRSRDLIGRVGGEEFWALLPDVLPDEARRVAERIRSSLADTKISYSDNEITITVSIGMTMMRERETLEVALARADRALYAAKNGGRNRVAADTPHPTGLIELEWEGTALSASSSVLPSREASKRA